MPIKSCPTDSNLTAEFLNTSQTFCWYLQMTNLISHLILLHLLWLLTAFYDNKAISFCYNFSKEVNDASLWYIRYMHCIFVVHYANILFWNKSQRPAISGEQMELMNTWAGLPLFFLVAGKLPKVIYVLFMCSSLISEVLWVVLKLETNLHRNGTECISRFQGRFILLRGSTEALGPFIQHCWTLPVMMWTSLTLWKVSDYGDTEDFDDKTDLW